MEREIAQKIISELNRFSQKKYAITDELGMPLAKSLDFSIEHEPLDVKSNRAFPIVFSTKKIGYLFIDENQTIAAEIGPILKSMAELILHQNYYANILTADEKRIDQLVYDFLKSDSPNLKEIAQAFASFGYDLAENRVALVLEISDPKYLFLDEKNIISGEREHKITRIKREIKFILDSFYTNHKNNIVAYLGGNDFVILKDLGENADEYIEEFRKTLNHLFMDFKQQLRVEITLGVGEFKPGLEGIRGSFEKASTALRFGKQNWEPGRIYYFDNFGVVAPLFSGVTEENVTFSKDLIEKLATHPDLLESLITYFESDISLSVTAKKLKIHRNTLVYRLDKIAEVTGLDPRVFNEAFQLQLALILDKYSGGSNA